MPVMKEVFKQVLLRFLKDKGIYTFIIGEINKEYRNFDEFVDKIIKNGRYTGVFNSKAVLSFDWEYTPNRQWKNNYLAIEKNVTFWRSINKEWVELCNKYHHFKEYKNDDIRYYDVFNNN
jgi:hypothetical protein